MWRCDPSVTSASSSICCGPRAPSSGTACSTASVPSAASLASPARLHARSSPSSYQREGRRNTSPASASGPAGNAAGLRVRVQLTAAPSIGAPNRYRPRTTARMPAPFSPASTSTANRGGSNSATCTIAAASSSPPSSASSTTSRCRPSFSSAGMSNFSAALPRSLVVASSVCTSSPVGPTTWSRTRSFATGESASPRSSRTLALIHTVDPGL